MLHESWRDIIEDIKKGIPLIVTDDESRENEGDFFVNASVASESSIKLMLNEGRGLICTPISRNIAEKLNLNLMVDKNTANLSTAFTISIDHKTNSTGISLSDRLKTILELSNPFSLSSDFLRPGHIFPLIANGGGIFERDGHTEAAIELSRIAGLPEVGVICEILTDEGKVAKKHDLKLLANKFNLKIISIDSLKKYLSKNISFDKIDFPTKFGHFDLFNFQHLDQNIVALKTKGELSKSPLVRIHSECKTGDVFSSLRCDCGDQLNFSLSKISSDNDGVLIYLNQEGRGIGFNNKIKAYKLQENGLDTYEANNALGFSDDIRDYSAVPRILQYFNISNVRLITNNPKKSDCLRKAKIIIDELINTEFSPNEHNNDYLISKIIKTNHTFKNLGDLYVQ